MKIKNEKNLKVTIISSISNWYVWTKIVNLYKIFIYQTAEKYEFWTQKKEVLLYTIFTKIYIYFMKNIFLTKAWCSEHRVSKNRLRLLHSVRLRMPDNNKNVKKDHANTARLTFNQIHRKTNWLTLTVTRQLTVRIAWVSQNVA